ncbi:SpoIVB peptidase S55 domain-containing protein [Halanaerocella petrolearia]
MQKIRKTILVAFICLLFSQIAIASPQIMPLDKVKPGMQGIGKTVIKGTKVRDFNVEVISILEQKANNPLILVKTSGEVIDKTGGIASGMSGSPVYIDGKLIGAVGYGWQMANHKIGMVTPIKSMLDIFKLNKKANSKEDIKLDQPIKVGAKEYHKVKFAKKEETTSSDVLVATPVTTPLVVSGLAGRARSRLAKELKNYDLTPVNGGGVVTGKQETTLEPGSAVAAQLVRGDINVSAIGTLTYRDQNQVLAFGHPFLSKGNANYFLSTAYVHQMITSVKMPFKLGSPIDLKGTINQDRSAGLAGVIDKYSNVVPVEVEVTDKDLEKQQVYNFQIVQDQELLPKLSAAALLQVIDSTIDRQGGGTAKVKMEIMGNNLPNQLLKKEDLYYNSSDIAATSLSSLLNGLNLIINNPFQKVEINGIKLNIEVEKESKMALVEQVELDKDKVKPGDEVEAKITLRPYRKEVVEKKVKVKIPEDVEAGKLELHILSGQEANLEQFTQQENDNRSAKANNIKSLEELIKVYQKQNQNNQLLVKVKPNYTSQSKVASKEQPVVKKDLVKEKIDTNYVLRGAVMEKVDVSTKQDKSQIKDNAK